MTPPACQVGESLDEAYRRWRLAGMTDDQFLVAHTYHHPFDIDELRREFNTQESEKTVTEVLVLGPRTKNLVGQTFNRLTVIAFAGYIIDSQGKRTPTWECKCECGTCVRVRAQCLKSGNTKSCGCLSIEVNRTKMQSGLWSNEGESGYDSEHDHLPRALADLRRSSNMTKWEYDTIDDREIYPPDFVQVLNKRGREGWDLIHVIESYYSSRLYIFKRPIVQASIGTPSTCCDPGFYQPAL